MAAASLAQAHRARLHDGRPAAAGTPGRDRRSPPAGPAPLSSGRGGAAVHRVTAPRARFRCRMPQRRAHRAQFQAPRRHPDSQRALAVDLREPERAGLR
ncbi:hypothetical protein G6F63_016443 [Rhizopus arrhizus]|nr:hypothetical protein G6F63_016443 [Rhizopus arrhizus]